MKALITLLESGVSSSHAVTSDLERSSIEGLTISPERSGSRRWDDPEPVLLLAALILHSKVRTSPQVLQVRGPETA